MAEKKISQLTAKSANLASTDLIPIAESDGLGGYVTKHVTGAEVVGGAGSTTIYNGDGQLSADRTIDCNSNFLKFSKLEYLYFQSNAVPSPSGTPFVDFFIDPSGAATSDIFKIRDTSTTAFKVQNDGTIEFNEAYTFPQADGVQGQVLRTDGAGALSFANLSTGVFSQTADGTAVTNTTTPTNIIGTGVGTLTVPANTFAVGDSFHCNIKGDLSSLNNETITVEVKSGSVVLASSGAITLPSITSKYFELEVDFTIRSIGGSGVASIITSGEFNYVQNSGNAFEGAMFHSLNNTTFDTTASNTLDVLVTWGSASASNSIKSHITNLRRIY